jgi:hypothetical protein
MFKFVLVQPWNIGVCRIVLVFVTELTVDLLSIKKAFDLVKIYLSFQGRRFLEIDQSETRIACGSHVC